MILPQENLNFKLDQILDLELIVKLRIWMLIFPSSHEGIWIEILKSPIDFIWMSNEEINVLLP
jgi:hypothetical protein